MSSWPDNRPYLEPSTPIAKLAIGFLVFTYFLKPEEIFNISQSNTCPQKITKMRCKKKNRMTLPKVPQPIHGKSELDSKSLSSSKPMFCLLMMPQKPSVEEAKQR